MRRHALAMLFAVGPTVKSETYEGLLEKNAHDVKGGAGQYFTPRPLIRAIVDCIQPRPGEVVADPACGTGGFLLAAHEYIASNYRLDRDQKRHLRFDALRGVELVDGVSRLCAMNLFLHGIGPDDSWRSSGEVSESISNRHGDSAASRMPPERLRPLGDAWVNLVVMTAVARRECPPLGSDKKGLCRLQRLRLKETRPPPRMLSRLPVHFPLAPG